MAKIEQVIFDLGGVLLNLDFSKTKEAFENMGVKNFRELFGLGHAASFFKAYEVGAISDLDFVEELQKLAGKQYSEARVIEAWNAMLLDFPAEKVQLLKDLSERYRLFLFSNTNAIHLRYFHHQFQTTYGILMDECFEKAYYSHLIQKRKPDPEAFVHVVQDAGINPETTLFIDDALVNIEGAQKAGLQAWHLRADDDLKTLLQPLFI